MKINKILILLVIVLIILADYGLSRAGGEIYNYDGEKVIYSISPFGKAEYRDFGTIDFEGAKRNLITFKTEVLFFKDTEKIYCDPESLLPYKIERTISNLLGGEYITEEYDQKNFTVTMKKFNGKKLVSEQTIQANGPIQNAILLPFYLRRIPGLKIGWNFTARLPDEFKLELVSIDKITVPAGGFEAYHFKSIPDKFEIWINKDAPRVPLKIMGKGAFKYALLMKEYIHQGSEDTNR